MKLLYGVTGEGMGHAMRSRVVIEHLLDEGHEVEIIASSRAADYLSEQFTSVQRIHGLHIVSEENRVRRGKTLLSNVLKGAKAMPGQIAAYFELTDDFEPEAVISDFETWTSIYGETHRLPVFSVDNMQVIDRCQLADDLIEGERVNFEIAKAFVKAKLPFSEHFFVTTFFHPEIRKPHTSLHPPILRPKILDLEPRSGDHLLVYQTSESHGTLREALERSGLECRIYGLRRDIDEDVVEGNLRFRPFSEETFVEDLASCRGVVASSGFTLMTESIYLHKPLLAIPLEGQYEQTLNARSLQALGYGLAASSVDDDAITRFVRAIPACEESLAKYQQDGNEELLSTLDEHLDRAAAGMYKLRPF